MSSPFHPIASAYRRLHRKIVYAAPASAAYHNESAGIAREAGGSLEGGAVLEKRAYDDIAEVLGVEPGITAIIGSGGKSTLMDVLAHAVARGGATALITTSTHIRRAQRCPVYTGADAAELGGMLAGRAVVCCGTPAQDGKLAAPALPWETLAGIADYVFVEADGSRGLPAKAHAAHEPVIPAAARLVIDVVGAQAFGRPLSEVAHRPELFCVRAGAAPHEALTPEHVAAVVERERSEGALHLPPGARFVLAVTHGALPGAGTRAARLARALDEPVYLLDHPTRLCARARADADGAR